MAKSAAAWDKMSEGPGKIAVSRQMTKVNTEMSMGNMLGACKYYMQAQLVQ